MSRFVVALPPDRLVDEGQDPHWSWLAGGMAEYYAGDVDRALELLQQAAESDTPRCSVCATVYLAMALKKLGRDAEAVQVLQEAEVLVGELRPNRTAEGWWDVDLAEMALHEARRLIAPPTEP